MGNLFTSSRVEVQRLEEEIMSLKLREMQTIIELKEHRLKIMELETQVNETTSRCFTFHFMSWKPPGKSVRVHC